MFISKIVHIKASSYCNWFVLKPVYIKILSYRSWFILKPVFVQNWFTLTLIYIRVGLQWYWLIQKPVTLVWFSCPDSFSAPKKSPILFFTRVGLHWRSLTSSYLIDLCQKLCISVHVHIENSSYWNRFILKLVRIETSLHCYWFVFKPVYI